MNFHKTPVAAAVAAALCIRPATEVYADDTALEDVVVTATRREQSVQDVPLNITAIGSQALEEQGITGLAELGRTVPGLYIVDQGARAANRIVVRGLNATSISASEGIDNDGGGTVATYIGEIPLYVDMRPVDIERVEVLLGPQGTLYGAGTLGGAIRYIPNRPSFSATSMTLRGDAYGLSESDGVGARGGFTLNVPFSDTLAFRTSVEYLDDPGFIDYNYLVREPGVSDPQPDLNDPAAVAANLRREEDADWQETLFGRAALRWSPNEAIDATLTHFYQNQEVGGRTVTHSRSFGTGEYESGERFLEPNERKNQLTSLEVTADLGFATLTSATGFSQFEELGQRDQTDLLITLEYGYESFPSFSAFTRDTSDEERINQELRLVSKNDGPLSWIAGAFYNKFYSKGTSKEFTPNFSEYLVDIGAGSQVRPDDLEYYSVGRDDLKEKAFYGEISYAFTPQWQVTLGARKYDYELVTQNAFDIPLFNTVFGGSGPDDIVLEFESGGQSDNGTLYKFNTSYKLTDELMSYLTVSEGYRIGNSNGVAPCPDVLPPTQIICALPNEVQYFADSTTNYEVGLHSRWLDRRLGLNASVYYIDWADPQIGGSTQNGAVGITLNGKGAKSQGFDLSFSFQATDRLSVDGSFAYTQAELTDEAAGLLKTIVPPGFQSTLVDVSGLAGDRLPGSPEEQGTLFLRYNLPLPNSWDLGLNYGFASIGNILTRTGERAGGEALPGFTVHQAWASLAADSWTVALYADNLFNKYAVTGVRQTGLYVQSVSDENGDPVAVRSYFHDVLRPRQVGLRVTYDFKR